MICPSCGTINKDSAKICRECHLHLAGRTTTEANVKKERKYIFVGAIAIVIIATLLIMFLSLMCNTCGSSCGEGGEDAINEQVAGDWDSVSDSNVSAGDAQSSDNSDFLEDPSSLSD